MWCANTVERDAQTSGKGDLDQVRVCRLFFLFPRAHGLTARQQYPQFEFTVGKDPKILEETESHSNRDGNVGLALTNFQRKALKAPRTGW